MQPTARGAAISTGARISRVVLVAWARRDAMQIKILTENVLTSFADLVNANKRRLYRVWLIAPLDGVRRESARSSPASYPSVNANRPLSLGPDHQAPSSGLAPASYLRPFVEHPNRGLRIASLHTKLYILECNGFRGSSFWVPEFDAGSRRGEQGIGHRISNVFAGTR